MHRTDIWSEWDICSVVDEAAFYKEVITYIRYVFGTSGKGVENVGNSVLKKEGERVQWLRHLVLACSQPGFCPNLVPFEHFQE